MQLFSADTTIFLKNQNFFLPMKSWKNGPEKLLIISPNFFSEYCQMAQNQLKSHFMFH